VQFEIDANGILNVLARDTKTGRQTLVEMKSAVDVDDAAVQQMVEESVEHAFDDLNARRWVESKLKAQELLTATRKGLAECEGDLSKEQSTKMREAMAAIESCLAGECAETASGDVKALQVACEALDQASHPLAELLMDRAMEALLRKRGMLI
jgi:molecular chaperone DnaK